MASFMFDDYLQWLDSQMADREVCLLIEGISANQAGVSFCIRKNRQVLRTRRSFSSLHYNQHLCLSTSSPMDCPIVESALLVKGAYMSTDRMRTETP